MAVLLANRRLGVRNQVVGALDAHGDRPITSWAAPRGPWPGRESEGADASMMGDIGGRTFVLAVDPCGWPLTQGDLVVDFDSGKEWLVTSADLLNNNADCSIDYIRVEAHARVASATRP